MSANLRELNDPTAGSSRSGLFLIFSNSCVRCFLGCRREVDRPEVVVTAGQNAACAKGLLRATRMPRERTYPSASRLKGLPCKGVTFRNFSDVGGANRAEVIVPAAQNSAPAKTSATPRREPPNRRFGEVISPNGRERSRERRSRCLARCTLTAGRCTSE